jgi:hypothetical protein
VYLLNNVTLSGARGALTWAGSDAATLAGWTIARQAPATTWTLAARVAKADSYRLKQTPLLFVAPRLRAPRGVWCFPVVPGTLTVAGGALSATLRHPEGR